MQKNCFAKPNFPKNLRLALIISLFPLFATAQSLTGLWIGKLSNDSITTRKDQSYELALTEYRGKVYGYSYTTFIVNDTLYYIVKRVKGKIENDSCVVEDDEIVSHNFFNKLDKGVKVTQTFRMNQKDSTWHIDGNWETPKTKKYYALTGGIALKEEKDFDKSRLLQHIGDLKLDNTIAFHKPEPKVYLPAPRKIPVKKEQPLVAKADPGKNKPDLNSGIGKLEIKNPEPIATASRTQQDTEPEIKINRPDQTAVAIDKDDPKQLPSGNVTTKRVDVTINNEFVFEERKKNVIQTVTYKSDSLVLSLYDNGEVDGDTVSVFFNGEILMEKQGLKSTALKKTIYLNPAEHDMVEILLFADNLGSFPPNTGLLIIRDGDDRYEIRFSADFEQSAAIILKRKKP